MPYYLRSITLGFVAPHCNSPRPSGKFQIDSSAHLTENVRVQDDAAYPYPVWGETMVRRKEPATFPGLRPWGKFFMFLAMALLMAACSPGPKSGEDLRGEIQDLKKEIKSMQEKLDKLQESQHGLQAGQQTMLALLQKSLPFPPPQ